MKNKTLLFLTLFVFSACSESLEDDRYGQSQNSITFNMSIVSGQPEGQPLDNTRAFIDETSNKITKLQYVILNADGQIMESQSGLLSDDFMTLTVDKLKDGDYSIVFYATTSTDKAPIAAKVVNGKLMVVAPKTNAPIGQDLLYAHLKFSVGKNNGHTREIPVELMRYVGRFEVQVNVTQLYTKHMIQRITLRMDDNFECYTQHNGHDDAPLSGKGTFTSFDMTTVRGFYSMPSKTPFSGTILVESKDNNNVIHQDSYRFTDVTIDPGMVSTITVDWDSPNKGLGFFRIRKSDLNAVNLSTMFLNTEPQEVFYDANQRSFTTTEPVQVRINADNKLQINSYVPIALPNVTIRCRFRKYSRDFYDLAFFEQVPAFSDIRVEMPMTSGPVTFIASDGRHVLLDLTKELKNEDCDLQVVCAHPYMAKIAQIKYPITLSFSAYGANEGHKYWLNMTPDLCRHACVLVVNLSYMWSTDFFEEKVKGWPGNTTTNGKALVNAGRSLPADEVVARARSINRLIMGQVGNGSAGLGGGTTLGIHYWSYQSQYWNRKPELYFYRECIYHEYAHCMDYGHDGTMTYGAGWVNLMQEVVRDLSSTRQLPISVFPWTSNY